MQQIIFSSKEHHDFYKEKVEQLQADDYPQSQWNKLLKSHFTFSLDSNSISILN